MQVKKVGGLLVVVLILFAFSGMFVSASWFSDFFGKFSGNNNVATGNAVVTTTTNSWVYQETANAFSNNTRYHVDMNYTKPTGATSSSKWMVRHGLAAMYNISIPTACWNANPTKLILRLNSNTNNGGGKSVSSPSCYTGSGWVNVGTESLETYKWGNKYTCLNSSAIVMDGNWSSGIVFNQYQNYNDALNCWNSNAGLGNAARLYEEAIWWNVQTNSSQPIACSVDSDCGNSTSNKFCSGNSSCMNSTSYSCSNPGTASSSCVVSGGGGCSVCPYGCNSTSALCSAEPPRVSSCTDLACTLYETQTVYPLNKSVGIAYIDSSNVAVSINGVVSNKLQESSVFVYGGLQVKIIDILYNSKEGGVSAVEFSYSSYSAPVVNYTWDTQIVNSGSDVMELRTKVRSGDVSIPILYSMNGAYSGTGKDSNNRLVVSTSNNLFFNYSNGDRYMVASWSDGISPESYYLKVQIVQEDGTNKVKITDMANNYNEKTVAVGDEASFGNVVITPKDISYSSRIATMVGAPGVSFSMLYTSEGMAIKLPIITSPVSNYSLNILESNLAANDKSYSVSLGINMDGRVTVAGTNADVTWQEIANSDIWLLSVSAPSKTQIFFDMSLDQQKLSIDYNGCLGGNCGSSGQICSSLISDIMNPVSSAEKVVQWNNTYRGNEWVDDRYVNYSQYSAAWVWNSPVYVEDEINYYYVSSSVQVFDDKNINLSEYASWNSNDPACLANSMWLESENKSSYYFICNWNTFSNSQDLSNNYKSNNRQLFWYNDNVVVRMYLYWGEQLTDAQVTTLSQQKMNDLIDSLQDNNYEYSDWSNFNLDYPMSSELYSAFADCASDITVVASKSWACKIEPVICPPHGYQTRTCTSYNQETQKNDISTNQIYCSPGQCSGCYVPRWFGENSDNKCIPYGFRFAQEKTVDIDSVEEGQTYGGDVIFNITDDNSAYLKFGEGDMEGNWSWVAFEGMIYEGNTYKYSYPNDKYYAFMVKDITPASGDKKGSITLAFIDNVNAYCDVDGTIQVQRVSANGEWAKCQNNYECFSNVCSNGECVDTAALAKQLTGFKGFVVKMLCYLSNPIDTNSYNQCLIENQ